VNKALPEGKEKKKKGKENRRKKKNKNHAWVGVQVEGGRGFRGLKSLAAGLKSEKKDFLEMHLIVLLNLSEAPSLEKEGGLGRRIPRGTRIPHVGGEKISKKKTGELERGAKRKNPALVEGGGGGGWSLVCRIKRGGPILGEK